MIPFLSTLRPSVVGGALLYLGLLVAVLVNL